MSDNDIVRALNRLDRELRRMKGFEVPLPAVWKDWAPAITGFSATPVGGLYRYVVIGKLCHISIRQPNSGTSNATTFTISLPMAAGTVANMVWVGFGVGYDNGAQLTVPVLAQIASAGTVITFFASAGGAVWTASGGKSIGALGMSYELP